MFGVDSIEFIIVAIVALLVIGPKDLPNVLRKVGHWVGKARGVARHFRSGLDTMIRESELDDMEKRWREENDRIMREHPPGDTFGTPMTDPSLMPPPAAVSQSDAVAPPAASSPSAHEGEKS